MIRFRTRAALLVLTATLATAASAQQVAPWSYSNFPAPVRDVAFDANGIAYASSGDTLTRIDPAQQQTLGTLTVSGGSLLHIVPEPSGCRIAVSDTSFGTDRIHLIEDLENPTIRTVPLAPLSQWQFGSWSLAWVGPNDLFVSGRYAGSGWANLRRVDVSSGVTQILPELTQDSMLWADATRSRVFVVEHNISSGPVSILNPSTGIPTQTLATTWFLWDIASNGEIVIVPTYGGGYVYDLVQGTLQQRPNVIGQYANYGPLAVAFAPHTDVVFEATWSHTESKRALSAYPTHELINPQVVEARPELSWTGNNGFEHGRIAISKDGHWLAMTLDDAVRFYDVRALAADPDAIFTSGFGSCPE